MRQAVPDGASIAASGVARVHYAYRGEIYVFPDTYISKLWPKQRVDWYVVDLESTNGISVNGQRVTSSRLTPGDEITVGTSSLRFDVD